MQGRRRGRLTAVVTAFLAVNVMACGGRASENAESATTATTTSTTVLGPAVEATAPASVPAGQPVTIGLKATGVTIVGADGDTSGKTGHFHLFVDRPPVAPGALIPTGDPAIIHTKDASVQLRDLAAGDHVVWVVIGDGVHRAFDPPVQAKVMFSVTG
jgi:hypothetical protein